MALGVLISATPWAVSNLRVETAFLPSPYALQFPLSEENPPRIPYYSLHSPQYDLYVSISPVPSPLLGLCKYQAGRDCLTYSAVQCLAFSKHSKEQMTHAEDMVNIVSV